MYCRIPFSGPSAAALNAALTVGDGRALLDLDREFGERHVGRRHADRDAVDLSLHLGDHERRRLGGAGGGRNDRQRRARARRRSLCGRSRMFWSLV